MKQYDKQICYPIKNDKYSIKDIKKIQIAYR